MFETAAKFNSQWSQIQLIIKDFSFHIECFQYKNFKCYENLPMKIKDIFFSFFLQYNEKIEKHWFVFHKKDFLWLL